MRGAARRGRDARRDLRRLALALASVVALCATGAGAVVRQADPSFAPGPPLATGARPCSVASADFNGDARPDLAIADCRADAVRILLNDGAGRFRAGAASPHALGTAPASPVLVATADVNSDGRTDLVVANGVSSDGAARERIAVLIGDGTGAFRPAVAAITPVVGLLDTIVATDVTLDGKTDLVIPIYRNRRNWLAVFRGDGLGGFVPVAGSPIRVIGTHAWRSVAVADFSGDGKPDVAGGDSEAKRISILLGDGSGAFREASTATVGQGPRSVVAGDINGDGNADLAVAITYGLNVAILLGDGSGRFHAARRSPIAVPTGASSLAVVDLNGDGRTDLATSGDALTILLGIGGGRFRAAAFSPFGVPTSGPLVASDFNGDGTNDVALPGAIMFQTRSTPRIRAPRRPTGPPDRAFSASGVPFDLGADGGEVAIVTENKKRCEPVVIWNALRASSTRFKPGYLGCFGDGVATVAIGDGQVAWIEAGGGNSQELAVMAAPVTGGRPKQVAYAVNGNRAGGDPVGGYVGGLGGGGPLLAFNSWHVVCNHRDPQYDYCDGWTDVAKRLQRITAARRTVVVKRGPSAYPLSAVGGGRMAVASGGAVTVLRPNGSRVATIPPVAEDPPRAVALSRTRLAVLRTFTLDLYSPATGRRVKSLALGQAAGLQLAGVNSKLALLVDLGRQTLVRELYRYAQRHERLVFARLADGKLVSFPVHAQRAPIDPTVTEAGLFYAYIDRRTPTKRGVVFEPMARLLSRF